jgi:hypothetical protein
LFICVDCCVVAVCPKIPIALIPPTFENTLLTE